MSVASESEAQVHRSTGPGRAMWIVGLFTTVACGHAAEEQQTAIPVPRSEAEARVPLPVAEKKTPPNGEASVPITIVRETADPTEMNVSCPKPDADLLLLHVFSKTADVADLTKLSALLEKDGFTVNYTETSEQPKVAAAGSAALFRRVFALRLQNKRSPMSSRSAYHCALQVSSFRIPARYKKFVSDISPPDPQLY